jgi:hypothetical protein
MDARKVSIELQPGFRNGYIATEMTAQARPVLKSAHIRLYAGKNQDLFKRGTTTTRFPITTMTFLWIRYQKSASPVLPRVLFCIDSAKALYPGIIAAIRKTKIRMVSDTIS